MLHVARVEHSGEDCRLEDGKEEDEEENDHLQADNAWNGATEWHYSDFETIQAWNSSKRPENLQDSERLDEGYFNLIACNCTQERCNNDNEIENIPRIFDITRLSSKYKANGYDLHQSFKRERHCHEQIDVLQHTNFVSLRVVKRRLERQRDCRDNDQDKNGVLKPFVFNKIVAHQSKRIIRLEAKEGIPLQLC